MPPAALSLSAQDRLFVLTGAGVSAESGLATFRGSGGLWNGHRVEDVATPEAWRANPALVWRFYSQRRTDALAAQPNPAHRALAAIESRMPNRFHLCTQNVDDLHERAGSHNLHHMHGNLFESRCEQCNLPFPDQSLHLDPTRLPRCPTCAAPIRPHIVWFGETPLALDSTIERLLRSTILLVAGTSGSVYPAAGFVSYARRARLRTIYVGPEAPLNASEFDEVILGTAAETLPQILPI